MTLNHQPGGRLPLLSVRPAVTFPASERHRPLASTSLYCLVTEAHACEQLAQGCYLEADQSNQPAILWVASEFPAITRHRRVACCIDLCVRRADWQSLYVVVCMYSWQLNTIAATQHLSIATHPPHLSTTTSAAAAAAAAGRESSVPDIAVVA